MAYMPVVATAIGFTEGYLFGHCVQHQSRMHGRRTFWDAFGQDLFCAMWITGAIAAVKHFSPESGVKIPYDKLTYAKASIASLALMPIADLFRPGARASEVSEAVSDHIDANFEPVE